MFLSILNNSITFNKLYIKDKTLYKIIYCKKNKQRQKLEDKKIIDIFC